MIRWAGEKKLSLTVTLCVVFAKAMGEISNATMNITARTLILNFCMLMERFYSLFRT